MSSFKGRVAKLENHRRNNSIDGRQPGLSREQKAEMRRVAAVCPNWQRFSDYLKTLEPIDDDRMVGIGDRHRDDAVRNAFARSFFEERSGDLAA